MGVSFVRARGAICHIMISINDCCCGSTFTCGDSVPRDMFAHAAVFFSFCSFRTEATEVVVMEEDTEEGMEDTVAGELFNDKHFGSSLKGIIVVILFTNHNTNVS